MALTLPPDVRDAINDLADATGRPAASIVTEVLVEMVPNFIGMAKVARAAKAGNKAAAKRALQHMYGDAMASMMATQLELPESSARKRAR